jgi:hypothetical protein
MRTQAPDTSPEVEKVQFDLLRQAGVTKRLQLARAQTASAIRLSRGRIAKRHPDWSEREVALHWATITYGEALTNRVQKYLEQREISP